MRRKASVASRRLTIAAVCLAVAGGLAFQRYARDLERQARPGGPMVDAVVAAADLARGHALAPEDLEIVRRPQGFVPPGTARDPADVVGRALIAPIAAGEPVTESRLGPAAGPIAALVPPGFRAFTVTTALPGEVVAAGDHVDVLGTFATGAPHTETIVGDAEVLSVLAGDGGIEGHAVVLVLLVTAADAERLAYARAFADLSVAIAPG